MAFPIRAFAIVLAALSGGLIGYDLASRDRADTGRAPVQGPPPPSAESERVVTTPGTARAQVVEAPRRPVAPRPLVPPSPPDSMPTRVPSTNGPAWRIRQEASAVAGLTNVFLSVPSRDPVSCGTRRRATLILRCLDDRTTALIGHDCETPFRGGRSWPVAWQLDDLPVTDSHWLPDARGETFGRWTYREARTFIEALMAGETLRVRFDDAAGVTSEMSFPIAGLDRALPPLRAACGWSERAPWEPSETGTDGRVAAETVTAPDGVAAGSTNATTPPAAPGTTGDMQAVARRPTDARLSEARAETPPSDAHRMGAGTMPSDRKAPDTAGRRVVEATREVTSATTRHSPGAGRPVFLRAGTSDAQAPRD